MGNSRTARYGDGKDVHGAAAAWPAALRQRWPEVVDHVSRALGAEPPAAMPAAAEARLALPPSAVSLLLKDEPRMRIVERLARRWKADEAEVVLLWAAQRIEDVEDARDAVTSKLRLLRDLESHFEAGVRRLKVTASGRLAGPTRLALRAHLLHCLASLPATRFPRPGRRSPWLTPEGAAFLERAARSPFGPARSASNDRGTVQLF